jgi:hypothetical protein
LKIRIFYTATIYTRKIKLGQRKIPLNGFKDPEECRGNYIRNVSERELQKHEGVFP